MVRKKTKGKKAARTKAAKKPAKSVSKKSPAKSRVAKSVTSAMDLLRSWSPSRYSSR